jgi:hypothetical protein
VAVVVAVLPVWLACLHCCFALRVLFAFDYVIAPWREARFAVMHAVSAVLSDFPLRSRNFGEI